TVAWTSAMQRESSTRRCTELVQSMHDGDEFARCSPPVRRSCDLGCSINDTRDLLGLTQGHKLTCAQVKALTERHVADGRATIRDLINLNRVLSQLAASVPDCPILDALADKHRIVREMFGAPALQAPGRQIRRHFRDYSCRR